jgi:hypothetical protein
MPTEPKIRSLLSLHKAIEPTLSPFTTSIAARVHVVLALRLKLKLWEYLQVYSLVLFGCLLKNTRLCHERRNSLKTLKI